MRLGKWTYSLPDALECTAAVRTLGAGDSGGGEGVVARWADPLVEFANNWLGTAVDFADDVVWGASVRLLPARVGAVAGEQGERVNWVTTFLDFYLNVRSFRAASRKLAAARARLRDPLARGACTPEQLRELALLRLRRLRALAGCVRYACDIASSTNAVFELRAGDGAVQALGLGSGLGGATAAYIKGVEKMLAAGQW